MPFTNCLYNLSTSHTYGIAGNTTSPLKLPTTVFGAAGLDVENQRIITSLQAFRRSNPTKSYGVAVTGEQGTGLTTRASYFLQAWLQANPDGTAIGVNDAEDLAILTKALQLLRNDQRTNVALFVDDIWNQDNANSVETQIQKVAASFPLTLIMATSYEPRSRGPGPTEALVRCIQYRLELGRVDDNVITEYANATLALNDESQKQSFIESILGYSGQHRFRLVWYNVVLLVEMINQTQSDAYTAREGVNFM